MSEDVVEFVEFEGLRKGVQQRTLVSLDNSYTLKIETWDPRVMIMGGWGADEIIRVRCERVRKGQ